MNYLALYRKYRPVCFEDVYGQAAIVKTMKAALKNNKVSHAYLFSGPRGTGKTTVAKLVGRIINCKEYPTSTPCGKCDICLGNNNGENIDIIEIDAASNNGVDEIREIRSKVSLVPSVSKYKIYIIDEVHMLTTGAFNALLKTLEEPPPHVIFILATTEPYKIPNTIISRCQRFDFKKVDIESIVCRLKDIIKNEDIVIKDDVLEEIAYLSDGGMRDAISLLDQLISYADKEPKIEDIHLINGTLTNLELSKFIYNIYLNKSFEVINSIKDYNSDGKDFVKIVDEIIGFSRNVLLNKMNCEEYSYITKELKDIDANFFYKVIDSMLEIKNNLKTSSYEKLLFELAVLKLMSGNDNTKIVEKPQKKIEKVIQEDIPEVKSEEEIVIELKKVEIVVEIDKEEKVKTINNEELDNKFEEFKKIRINNVFATADKKLLREIKSKWSLINEYSVDEQHGISAGMLLDGNVRVIGVEGIIISYKYSSISDRVNKELIKIEKLIKEILENEYKVICVDDEEWEIIKKEYIRHIKAKKSYEIIKENIKIKDIIVKKEIGKKKTKKISKEVEDAMSLFGDDIVEII